MTDTSKSLIFKTLKSASPYLSRSGKSKTCDLCSGCSKLQNYQFLFKSDKERVSFATPIVYLLLLTHTKQLLLVTFFMRLQELELSSFKTHKSTETQMNGQTDREVEMMIKMKSYPLLLPFFLFRELHATKESRKIIVGI